MKRKAMLKSALAWLLTLSMVFPNTALTAYAAEAGTGISAEQGTQAQDAASGNDGGVNHSENDQDGNVGSGDENGSVDGENEGSGDENGSVDGENEGSRDENGSVDGENEGSGDENGSVDGENEGSGDENGSVDGENTGSGDEDGAADGENTGSGDEDGATDEDEEDADVADGEEVAEDKKSAEDENVIIDKKLDSLTAQTTETVMQGTFTNLKVRIGRYQVTQINGYYTPTNAGVTSKDQLKIVLEQLDSQGTVLVTEDIYFYKSGEKYYFYDYSGVVLKDQTAQVRIKVTETVDGTATDYVSETFTRSISSKTPVFTMTQNGDPGVNSVDYNWSVSDYEAGDTNGYSEKFKLQFTYCKKDNDTSETENKTISVYAYNSGTAPSGTVTLENLAENTTYTISAKIYIADDAGTDVFAQTITLPDFTTGTEETYPFATIIPDTTLRSAIASEVSGLSSTAETVTKSQLEKVTYLSASRYKSSDAAVKSLEGIEYLTNLESLYLNNHELTDISNVNWSSLKKLESLSLNGNDISKAVDLSGMSGLQTLYLKENMLKAEDVASIKAKLPASCTYTSFDNQRVGGVVLLAEQVYYQVDGKSPLFVRIKGIKSGLNDHVISFQLDGADASFTESSSYSSSGKLYYLADSGLTAGDTSHTIKATVDGVTKEATFQIAAESSLIETKYLTREWNSVYVSVEITGTDKTVTDIEMTDASGKVYGEKDSTSSVSSYLKNYDERYQTVGEGSSLWVNDAYTITQYSVSLRSIRNTTPVGSYNLLLTYKDGTTENFEDVFQVLGDTSAYIADIYSSSEYDNMNDYLYVTLTGANVDCAKLNYKVTDENGNEKAVSYVSVKEQRYGTGDTYYIVKLKKSGWKPSSGDRVVVEITAKDGYKIEILDNKATCYLQSGVFYVGWNPASNAMEVAVTQDMEVSSIRVELRNNTDSWEDQGDEFLSGETDSISQGFALVPLTDSEGNTKQVSYGYYWVKVYLNGSETANYSNRQYMGSSSSYTVYSYWSGTYYLKQGTSGVKYYYNMLGYDTYKNATFRAELLDSKDEVQKTWSDNGIARVKNGNYLVLTVADSKDFCDLEPGSYTLRLYYQTAAMEQESWTSYSFNIIAKDKFLMSSQYGGWIEDDTIQLSVYTANAADAEKLKVQMFDSEGNELTVSKTSVEAFYGNTVYLNIKVENLTYDKALHGYYIKVTHSEYGTPYQMYYNDKEFYTDEKGKYESLSYYGIATSHSNNRMVGIGCRGFKLPVTISAYLPYDTEVKASFTASSRSSYGSGYSWINLTQAFINRLPDKNRLYDVLVTDSTGRSYLLSDEVLGYSGTTAKLTGLTMSPTTMTLAEGATGKLSVTAKPTNASLPSLEWSSSDTKVATVSASGVVTAVAAGTATITVAGGGYSATCKVTVQAQLAKPTAYDLTEAEGTYDSETGVITVNKKGTAVKLQSDTTGATIYYTTDGTDPTTKSTKYNATAGITIIKDTTVKAIAVKSGSVNSEVATFECKLKEVTVTFKAVGATPEEQTQKLYAGEYLDMSKIVDPVYADDAYYFDYWKNQETNEKLDVNNAVTDSFTCEAVANRKDGLDAPKANYESNVKLPYGSVITLSVQKARSAYAYEEEASGESAVEYAADAVIYYTLDGTEPTVHSEVYTGSITLTEDVANEKVIILKAMATGTKYVTSRVSTYTYEMMTEEEVKKSLGDVQPEDIPSEGVIGIGAKGLWIAGVDENGYTYTGSAIKPSVRVYDGTKLLTEKKDYTISYSNNTNVPKDESAKQPTVKITGKGNYSGTQEVTFKILPKNISDSDMTADDIYVMCTGKLQIKEPVLKWGKKKLSRSNNPRALKDYMAFYGEYHVDGDKFRVPGKYVITLEGTGNYTGTRTVTEIILDKDTETMVSKLTVTMKNKKPQYTGKAIKAEDIGLVVKNGKTVLKEGTDYELIYRNNTDVGTATVTVKGLHEYVGTKDVTFQITGVPMSKVKLADAKAITNKEYVAGTTEYTQSGYTLTYSYKDAAKESHKDTLVEDTDYTVSYLNNTKVGTAKIVFTGKGKYTGTLTKTFKITQNTNFNGDTVDVLYNGSKLTPEMEIPYSKGGAKPEITVKIGDTELVNGTDYKVSYKNNTKVYDPSAKNAKKSSIVITGKGNYKGSVTKEFEISAQDISVLKSNMTAADVVWKNKKNNYKTKVVITDLDGKVLKENTDYTLTYWQGDKQLVANAIASMPEQESSITITVKATGKGAYVGGGAQTIVTHFRMAMNDFSKVKLVKTKAGEGNIVTTGKIEDQIYTGKEIELKPQALIAAGLSFKNGKTETFLTADDFTIDGYKNNVKKGTATVILKGTGDYAGQKTLTFKIVAKSMKDN